MYDYLENSVVVAVDFDGTITNEPRMVENPTLRVGAKETLTKWKEQGVVMILWTCRSGKGLDKALDFLKEHDMLDLFVSFNSQLPEIEQMYYPDVARKVGADFYVDDRNLGSEVSWEVFDKNLQKAMEEFSWNQE